MFEGHRIDLAQNWEQAQACIVLRQAQIVECFRTLNQAEERATAVMPQFAAAGFSCSSPLRLFEHRAGFSAERPCASLNFHPELWSIDLVPVPPAG